MTDDSTTRRRAALAFAAYDRNNDGLVSKGEMLSLSGNRVTRKQVTLQPRWTEWEQSCHSSQVEKCFEVNDEDKDGFLTREELEGMMVRTKRRERKERERREKKKKEKE